MQTIPRNAFLHRVYLFTEDICNGGLIIYGDPHNISMACLQLAGELEECREEGRYSRHVRQ
jgi:hypothetical protein